MKLSNYQKRILGLFENSTDYIRHTEGIQPKAQFYSPNKKEKISVRFDSVEILYNKGYLKYISGKDYRLTKTTKKIK